MTDNNTDDEILRQEAEDAAVALTEWMRAQLEHGAHPSAVAAALIGMGSAFACQLHGPVNAARIMRRSADDMRTDVN